MQTKTKLKGVKERNLYRRLLGGSLASLAILLLIYTIVPTLISEASATQDVTVGANWIATSLTLDPDYGNGSMSDAGHGDIAFGDIIPTSTADGNIGTERVIKKTIGIESSGKYYSIYLSMANDSSALKLNGDDSNIRIDPVTGTWDSPAAFSATSWGYAVPNTPVPTSASTWQESSTPEYPTFSQATTFSDASNLGIDLTKNNHGSIYNQDTWAAAPVLGSAQQIWKAETTNNYGFGGENGDNINNHFDIYYGIMVGSDTLAGTYENQLIYTALASAQAIDEISHNLLVSERFVASGTTQTLKFDLASSQSGLIKPSQVYAYVVPHSDVTPNTIAGEQEGETRLETDEEVLIRLQNNLAQDSSYYDACSFNRTDSSTDIVFDTDGITITCSMPAETPAWDGGLTNSATATDGYYDIWIAIPSYSANYISKTTEVGTNNRVASIVYAGLQSVDENGDKFISEMQEMRGAICKNTNIWNDQTGDNARIMDYSGTSQLIADIMTTEVDEETGVETEIVDGAATSEASAAVGIGSFLLTDNRDQKPYLVRRLADENCWMAQNLDLDLVAVADGNIALDSTNTDLNSKTSWQPDAATITSAFNSAGSANRQARFYENGFDYVERINKLTDVSYNATHATQYIGDYYNFYAATAETETFNGSEAIDSICAKSWTLPVLSGDKSYYGLLHETYGIADRLQDISTLKVLEVPVSLALGGQILSSASQNYVGKGFYYAINRSGAKPLESTADYQLWSNSFNDPTRYPSLLMQGTVAIYSGRTIRCVARD